MDILQVFDQLDSSQECDALLGLVKLQFESDEQDLRSSNVSNRRAPNSDQLSGARTLLSMKLKNLENQNFDNFTFRRKRKRALIEPNGRTGQNMVRPNNVPPHPQRQQPPQFPQMNRIPNQPPPPIVQPPPPPPPEERKVQVVQTNPGMYQFQRRTNIQPFFQGSNQPQQHRKPNLNFNFMGNSYDEYDEDEDEDEDEDDDDDDDDDDNDV